MLDIVNKKRTVECKMENGKWGPCQSGALWRNTLNYGLVVLM
jgi:hypothetical protein